MNTVPLRSGDFVWTLFPYESDPDVPGPIRHAACVIAAFNQREASTATTAPVSSRGLVVGVYASIDGQQNVVLCHYAWRTWPRIRKGALMLYGHSHGRLRGNVQSCDIGVDTFGWSPVRMNTIKDYLATLPLMDEPEARDEIDDPSNQGPKLW